jgi:hypothetical protein
MGPRGPNFPGFPGFGGGSGQEDAAFVPLFINAVVEVTGARKTLSTGRVQVDHKWGSTTLYQQKDLIEYETVRLPTVAQRYQLKWAEVVKGGKPTEKNLEELADWALTHGLLDEFVKDMKQLEEIAPTNKAAVAFKQVTAAMERPITRADSSDVQRMFRGFKSSRRSAHYVLYYDGSQELEMQSRLQRLEDNYKAFFYWFALKGYVLTPPDYRLAAILIEKKNAFKDEEKAFDSPTLVADGFYARRENLAIFSLTPLEDLYDALDKSVKDKWREGWNMDTLLHKNTRGGRPRTATWDQVSYMQTIVLLMKALQEESEIATVSHEGTRQLLAASGRQPGTALLPRTVTTPRWIEFGMGSFFETPKGAYWVGTGAPSWKYLMDFKARQDLNKIDKPEVAVRKIITDAYFKEAETVQQHARSTKLEADATKAEGALLKARSMTWALTYYLARRQLEGLLSYFEELNNLPRDLEFDDKVLEGCFARAFHLTKDGDPNQIDSSKLDDLARDWFQVIQYTSPEVQSAQDDYNRAIRERLDRRQNRALYTPPRPGNKSKPPDKGADDKTKPGGDK